MEYGGNVTFPCSGNNVFKIKLLFFPYIFPPIINSQISSQIFSSSFHAPHLSSKLQAHPLRCNATHLLWWKSHSLVSCLYSFSCYICVFPIYFLMWFSFFWFGFSSALSLPLPPPLPLSLSPSLSPPLPLSPPLSLYSPRLRVLIGIVYSIKIILISLFLLFFNNCFYLM